MADETVRVNAEARHGSAGARPSDGGLGAMSGPPARKMSGSEREPETSWGDPVRRVYGPSDVPADAGHETPGEFPFTRGIHPSG